MRHAIVVSEKVINIVEASEALEPNWHPIPDGQKVAIGDGFVDGAFISQTEQEVIISITATADKTRAKVGDVIHCTASFSNKELNFPEGLDVSIVSRLGDSITNIDMLVVNGEGTGSFTIDRRGDHCLTNEGVNHWQDKIPLRLQLDKEIVIRVS